MIVAKAVAEFSSMVVMAILFVGFKKVLLPITGVTVGTDWFNSNLVVCSVVDWQSWSADANNIKVLKFIGIFKVIRNI